MTQAAATGQKAAQQPKTVDIPAPTMPLVTRVWSKAPFSDDKFSVKAGETILTWQLSKPHPLLATHTIVRMFSIPGGAVEVYATDQKAEVGTRHTIPWHQVTFIEEAMDPQTFVDEIVAAESGDEEDEEDGDEPEVGGAETLTPLPAAGATTANGAGGSS